MSGGRGAGSGGISQAARGVAPVFGGWAGRGHGDLDTAHGDAHQRTDLEELEADGAAGGVGKCGVGESDSPLAKGVNMGVYFLLATVAGVLIAFAVFMIYLARRARVFADDSV